MYMIECNKFIMNELKVIDRGVINQNIIFCDITDQGEIINYSYQQFEDLIDKIKSYLLSKYNIRPGETAVVGYENTCVHKIAAFFACLELGLSITIIDHQPKFDNSSLTVTATDGTKIQSVDTKTQLLSPINYFICGKDRLDVENDPKSKSFFLHNYCSNTIYHNDITNFSYDKAICNDLKIDPKSIAMRCTSSGTTGTPKVIEHTHEFLFDLCKRNSKMFYGNIVNEKCLGHGSGPSTYFIPTLMSKNVEKVFNFWGETDDFIPAKYPIRNENLFDHIMIAYTHDIDIYLEDIDDNHPASNLTIYTLSTIKKEWISYVKDKKIKNIISLFGSSETAGPIFINQANDENFVQNKFSLIDEYYKVSFTNKNLLEVLIPVYNKKINTNDEFLIDANNKDFYHNGRSDLIRINGKNVNISKCDKILSKLNTILDAKFIYDTAINEIYLAVWESSSQKSSILRDTETLDSLIKKINVKMLEFSSSHHYISKYQVLDQAPFFTGIKLDNQLLRDYFRSIDN